MPSGSSLAAAPTGADGGEVVEPSRWRSRLRTSWRRCLGVKPASGVVVLVLPGVVEVTESEPTRRSGPASSIRRD